MKEVPLERLNEEEWLWLERSIRYSALQTFMNAIVDLGGSENAIKSERPYIRLSAQAFSMNMIKMFGLEGDSLDVIEQLCYLYEKLLGFDMKELYRDEEKIIRAGGVKCEGRDNPIEGCICGHSLFIDEICRFISPDYGSEFTQMVPKGDQMCSYVVSKKKKLP